MKIGELAERSGMSVQTLRFYERSGLIPEPRRTQAGYRIYANGDLRRVEVIRQAKRLGFSLGEIKRIFRLRQQGSSPCREAIGILETRLRETVEQIRELQRFRKEIARTLHDWNSSRNQAVPSETICGLIERTIPKRTNRKGENNGIAKR